MIECSKNQHVKTYCWQKFAILIPNNIKTRLAKLDQVGVTVNYR